jgi:hypothetical protein
MNQPLKNDIELFYGLKYGTKKLHKLEIWFVEHNKKYYVLSELKGKHRGFKTFFLTPKYPFRCIIKRSMVMEDIDYSVEKDLIHRISQLMNNKYGWSDGLIVELYQ